MIAVDTSALFSVVAQEPGFDRVAKVMAVEKDLIVSAGTLTEAMVVAARRGLSDEMTALIRRLNVTVAPVTAETAARAGEAYRRWGKGFHPAALNFGDCFSYATAQAYACPLLYIGDDFGKTDLVSAMDIAAGEGNS